MNSAIDANKIYTEIFYWFLARWNLIENFKKNSLITEQQRVHLLLTHEDFIYSLANDAYYQKFSDQEKLKALLKETGTKELLVNQMVSQELENYATVVDTTCLTLAHNILDTVAIDLIKLSSVIDIPAWISRVQDKTILLKDIVSFDKDDLIRATIRKKVEDLERDTLIKKIRVLQSICSPQKSFIKDYKYSEERIENLDKLRHKNVHGKSSLGKLPKEDLDYLKDTFAYLFASMNEKYDLKLDPDFFFQKNF